MASNNFRVRRRFDGQSIAGKADFLAVTGLMVALNASVGIEPTLQKAQGQKGFCLVRDIVEKSTLASQLIVDSVFLAGVPIMNPEVKGGVVSASKVLEAELEGVDLIQESGTGAISSGTAEGTELSSNEGRLRVKQGSEEVAAILREQLTPLDSDNDCRIRVEYSV